MLAVSVRFYHFRRLVAGYEIKENVYFGFVILTLVIRRTNPVLK